MPESGALIVQSAEGLFSDQWKLIAPQTDPRRYCGIITRISYVVDVTYVWEVMGDSLDIDHILEGSLDQPSTTDTGELNMSIQV